MEHPNSAHCSVPCRRFDQAGDQDIRLTRTLSSFSSDVGFNPIQVLIALYDHNDRLWATWSNKEARTLYARNLTLAWMRCGGKAEPVHLVNAQENMEFEHDDLDGTEPN